MADRVRDHHAQVHGPVRAAAAAPTGEGRSASVPKHGSAAGAGIAGGAGCWFIHTKWEKSGLILASDAPLVAPHHKSVSPLSP